MIYAIILVIPERTEAFEFTEICSMFEPKFEENQIFEISDFFISVVIPLVRSSVLEKVTVFVCNFYKTELLLKHYSRILPVDRLEQNVQYKMRIQVMIHKILFILLFFSFFQEEHHQPFPMKSFFCFPVFPWYFH